LNLRRLVLLKVVLIHNSTPTIVTALSAINIVVLQSVWLTAIISRALEVNVLLAETAVGVTILVDGGSVVAAVLVEIGGRLELVLDLVSSVVETAHENSLGVLEGSSFDAESTGKDGCDCEGVHDGEVKIKLKRERKIEVKKKRGESGELME
jgi:hypothetical protein